VSNFGTAAPLAGINPSMRFKSSQALVFSQSNDALIAFNFLTKSAFQCSQDLLVLLGKLQDWKTPREIGELAPALGRDEITDILVNLETQSAIVQEGSAHAAKEAEYEKSWTWGIPSALMHYSVQDNEYISMETAEALQKQKASDEGKIDLFTKNTHFENTITLPVSASSSPLLKLMAKRRTVRRAEPQAVSLQQLSDCLFAGLGITGETENCVGKLPLSMTPSGGARNPYEAYVIAKNIHGLDAGIYHYSATEHSFGAMGYSDDVSLSALIGGQDWGDEMACLIVLCAHLDRTMWKYVDANAYRVVLIEAGHIGQNIMLAATDNALSACPTAALSHSKLKSALGITSITQAPIYALSLGVPAAE
jgi:SagB-type dehydrogenase family enzyme